MGAKLHCESSLFISDVKAIAKNCKTHIFPNVLLPRPAYITNGIWAVSTNEIFSMSVSCNVPSGRVIKVHPPLTLFQLNETCFATSTYFTIPARHTFSSKVKLEPTMPHLADLNIRNASYWGPLEETVETRPVKNVLKKLGSLKSFPLSRLVSELNQVKENPMEENQGDTW